MRVFGSSSTDLSYVPWAPRTFTLPRPQSVPTGTLTSVRVVRRRSRHPERIGVRHTAERKVNGVGNQVWTNQSSGKEFGHR